MAFQTLKIEYLKLKGNTSFKIFALFFFVFLPIIIFTVPTLVKDGIGGAYSYPFLPRDYETTWYFTAYLASWFSLFLLAFVLIFHITNEYTYKTVRQNIIDGYSRSDFFLSKVYLLLAMAIIATLYVAVIGFSAAAYYQTFTVNTSGGFQDMLSGASGFGALSSMFGGTSADDMTQVIFTDGLWSGSLAILSYFVQVLGYLIFAMLVAFLLKRGAIAIIVYLSAFIVERIIGAQLSGQYLEVLGDNLPLYSFSQVLPNPKITDIVTGLSSVKTLNIHYVILTFVFMFMFLLITRWFFGRRDVA